MSIRREVTGRYDDAARGALRGHNTVEFTNSRYPDFLRAPLLALYQRRFPTLLKHEIYSAVRAGLPAGATYSFTPAALTLAATDTTVTTNLSISMAGAAMPLASDYTVTVQASAAGGGSRYAGPRLSTRSALFTAVSKVGCNSSNQMDERVSWQMNGSIAPALFIQDAITPAFPGRKLMNLSGSSGTIDTGYVVNAPKSTLLWLVDQSAGPRQILRMPFKSAT